VEKRQIWSMRPILSKLGVTHDLGVMAHWKVHGRLSIRVNWTFFAIDYSSRVLRQNVYSSAVFAAGGVDRFALKFYPDRVTLSTILCIRKLETLGYPMVETGDRILRSFILTQCRSVSYGRIWRYIQRLQS